MRLEINGGDLILKKKRLNSVLLWLFFPIYFTTSGIYRFSEYTLHDLHGLVLPFTVILGLLAFLKILKANVKGGSIKYDSDTKLLLYLIIFFNTIFMYTLFGFMIYKIESSIILTIQFTTGVLGVFISLYLVKYKDMNAKDIFYGISVVFLVAIISNISLSIVKVGLKQTFSRNIYGATPLGGIYHIYVYYPFIVATVFNFALPFWEKRKALIPVYTLVTIYILSIQVKGAILAYSCGVMIYFLFFTDKNKLAKRIAFIMMTIMMITILPKEFILGRFTSKSTSLISGRELVWGEYIDRLKIDPLHFLRGSFVQSTTLQGRQGSLSKGGFHSYHNQYLEILDSYGFFILLFFLVIIILFLFKIYKKLNMLDKKTSIRYKYWTVLILLHFMIDLNVNVPLRVTNPAIILLFYWTTLFLLLKKETDRYSVNVQIEV